jgi:phosphoribosylformylglycinamidine cyclo-ligase
VEQEEMHRVFNMGIGLALVVSAEAAVEALERVKTLGEQGWLIGEIVASPDDGPEVEYVE